MSLLCVLLWLHAGPFLQLAVDMADAEQLDHPSISNTAASSAPAEGQAPQQVVAPQPRLHHSMALVDALGDEHTASTAMLLLGLMHTSSSAITHPGQCPADLDWQIFRRYGSAAHQTPAVHMPANAKHHPDLLAAVMHSSNRNMVLATAGCLLLAVAVLARALSRPGAARTSAGVRSQPSSRKRMEANPGRAPARETFTAAALDGVTCQQGTTLQQSDLGADSGSNTTTAKDAALAVVSGASNGIKRKYWACPTEQQ